MAKAKAARDSINNERHGTSIDEMFADMDVYISSLKTTIWHSLVGLGYYALFATLGLQATVALSAMIPVGFLSLIVLIFGVCVSIMLAVVAAELVTPPTLHFSKLAFTKAKSLFTKAKSKVNGFKMPKFSGISAMH